MHNQIRKIMKKRIFAVAAALCLMAGTGAFAQEAKPAAAPKERPTVEQMTQRMTERMQKELKLTDAQAKEVYNLNFQQIKEMQAMREKMREARKAEAEKMKSILTTEQFVQWSQMQAPRPGQRGHGPQMMKKGDRRGGGTPPGLKKPDLRADGTGNAIGPVLRPDLRSPIHGAGGTDARFQPVRRRKRDTHKQKI